ncbi:4a-hydroxytetrahydrobiopterin dehydratase [Ferrimicrobium sp.]|uniref:4a-hydroxytetrahydrobiopterin dehydratase n=1 Tax=Ferrimicrobium sp. TaxID=2926050 RepID=UPI00260436DA|nr:4a-hydroxytetrahydrobiopterin dehydratase [Ferrimicrobium sp.]
MERAPEGWSMQGAKLVRRIELDNYWKVVVASLAISLVAIWRNHHPTLIVEFGGLVVELSSHDVGAVTERDLELARLIDSLIPPRGSNRD